MKVFEPHVLKELKERTARDGSPVLSVYLNIDPSLPANAKGGYRTLLDQMLEKVRANIEDSSLKEHFEEDSRWIRSRVEHLIPGGKTYVAFCDVSEDFYYEEELPLRLANVVAYEDTPYVRPLIEAMDEYERYGVVLLDREKARFFIVFLGQIEELEDAINIPPVRHRKTSGTDHMRSQMVFQRRAETWSSWFLKELSERLQELTLRYQLPHLILMGPPEVTAEFYRLLPRSLQEKVVDRVRMPVKASEKEVLEACIPAIEERERAVEEKLVKDVVTAASKSGSTSEKAVMGINGVLDAINQGRVYLLVYPSGYAVSGYYCPRCEVLLDHAPENANCPYCSAELEEVDDIIWLASEKVLASKGRIEEVRSPGAKKYLEQNGFVGAFLR
ncbi:hypothetical protein [Thermodesulforhabdus norvegica]|uniref:Peptide chain release factor 1 (ERF1) n=1 Tax=Thermodesulforhabdus norvegica TaxID=39841 RepID=A0A1I4RGA4_9BACT|nr:hypothetical protein [Thermodesulforhabdus norvegica]SFM50983.1 Peptide chain release factor 1 (eRF1) [Thermodesulforhabdus norvegica]